MAITVIIAQDQQQKSICRNIYRRFVKKSLLCQRGCQQTDWRLMEETTFVSEPAQLGAVAGVHLYLSVVNHDSQRHSKFRQKLSKLTQWTKFNYKRWRRVHII